MELQGKEGEGGGGVEAVRLGGEWGNCGGEAKFKFKAAERDREETGASRGGAVMQMEERGEF